MSIDIISQRLQTYACETKQAEENALKEICQEIALAGLARAGFFKKAMFQGGTSLRILHGLNRFSEDLDFILNEPGMGFSWAPLLSAVQSEFAAFGLTLEAKERSKASEVVQKAFLKENSFGQVLNLKYQRSRADLQKIVIKLEIDTEPPSGSKPESHFLEFPYAFSIVSQDLPSLFAGKCHALLCRQYIKGRDWFDFLWYVQRKTQINYVLLENALKQTGPYQETVLNVTRNWLLETLTERVMQLDWQAIVSDVEKFIPVEQQHILRGWDATLFSALIGKLENYLLERCS